MAVGRWSRRTPSRAPELMLVAWLATAAAAPGAMRAEAGPWINLSPGGGGAFTTMGAGPTGTIVCAGDLSGAYLSRDRGLSWETIGFDRGLKRTHVSAVGFDPTDPLVIHLGTEAGVYRSGDGGNSFQQVLSTGYLGAVTPARSNPSIVYAAYHPSYGANASDIYRSTDRGRTYAPLHSSLPPGLRILKLLVSPTDPGTLFMLSGRDLFVAGTETLYRSRDGGLTWTAMALDSVWDVAMNPAAPTTLYATVYRGVPRSSWTGSVYKTSDGGDTWAPVASHTGAILVKRNEPQVVRVIDVDRGSSDPEGGVWESRNGGSSWSRISTMGGWESGWMILNWAYDGGAYGMSKTLGEDLSDPEVIFWTDWYFAFASFDGGRTFGNLCTSPVSQGRWTSRGIDNVTVASLACSEADPALIYTGYHDLGMWRSQDGGASWSACNDVTLSGTWKGHGGNTAALLADPARSGVVWASNGSRADTANLGRSVGAGAPESWAAVSGLPAGFIRGLSLSRTSPVTQRTLFVTSGGDVYRSRDDGVSWSLVFDCNGCRATAVDCFDGSLVYAGGEGGLWRSLSGGDPGTWIAIGPAAMAGSSSQPVQNEQWEGVHQIAPDPRQSGRVFVTAYGSGRGLYRSGDGGTTWTRLRASAFMRGVAIDPMDTSILYATSSAAYKAGGSATSGSEGILRSIDGGLTWTSIADGLAWPFGGPVALDPSNRQRVILGAPGTGFRARTVGGPGPDTTPPAAIVDLH